MRQVQTLLKALTLLARHPTYLRRVIDREAEKKHYVIQKYGLQYGLPVVDLLDLFPNLEETVKPYSFLGNNSLPIDLAVLKALARRYEHCRYLEIGTWRGESAANIAEIAEECVSIDLPEEELRRRGFSDGFIANMRVYSQGLQNIQYVYHDARTLDFSTLGKFDLVFIDGDHSYEGVKSDTENAFKVLRDNRSVIVWHDYGVTTETIWWSVLAGILDGCPEQERSHLYHISNTLCAIYTKEEIRAAFTAYPQIPNKSFEVKIIATRL